MGATHLGEAGKWAETLGCHLHAMVASGLCNDRPHGGAYSPCYVGGSLAYWKRTKKPPPAWCAAGLRLPPVAAAAAAAPKRWLQSGGSKAVAPKWRLQSGSRGPELTKGGSR